MEESKERSEEEGWKEGRKEGTKEGNHGGNNGRRRSRSISARDENDLILLSIPFTFSKVLTLTFFITPSRTFLYINVSTVAVVMQYLENVLLYS